MSDHHRGRSRQGYYDDDYYYVEQPRHHSSGRQALDKLEDAMERLTVDKPHRGRSSNAMVAYDDDYHHHHHHHHRRRPSSSYSDHRSRRYHSVSPIRSRRQSRHSDLSHRGREKSRHSQHSSTSSRSRSRWNRGLTAAVDAAALEAFRLRNEPGPWKGKKGQRIATAAVSAGLLGTASEMYHRDHNGDYGDGHDFDLGKKGTLGSAIGGLVVNRLVHGPRSEVRR